jgi:hypothetical protein
MNALQNELETWPDSRWWQAEEYARIYENRFSHEQIDRAIGAVARAFDQKWAQAARPHPACFYLLSQGSVPLQFLVNLGNDLLSVEKSKGFAQIQRDLREPGNFESARLELSVASLLNECDHEIEFHPKLPNGRHSDIVARKAAQEVYFEVKIIREAQTTDALSAFTDWLMREVDSLIRSVGSPFAGKEYQIELVPELAEVLRAGLKADPEFVGTFSKSAWSSISESIRRGSLEFSIPRLGSFSFKPSQSPAHSTLSSHPLSSAMELRRILGVLADGAMEQLPGARPGIFVVRTAGGIEEDQCCHELMKLFHEKGDQASHVSAVILLPVFYSLPQRWSLFEGLAIENPLARFPASSLSAFQTLVEECALNQRNGEFRVRENADGVAGRTSS